MFGYLGVFLDNAMCNTVAQTNWKMMFEGFCGLIRNTGWMQMPEYGRFDGGLVEKGSPEHCVIQEDVANPATMIKPNILIVMTMVIKGVCFVFTTTMIVALPWCQRFRSNRELWNSSFNPGNLRLVNGTVSDFATTGETVVNVFSRNGVIDDLGGTHDWFRTAAKTAAENLFDCFDFYTDNKLRCGAHDEFRTIVARGMILCERVPPDITVAVEMSATWMHVLVSAILARCFLFVWYLSGTYDLNFDVSVNNPHMNEWYADASMLIQPGVKRHICGLMRTDVMYWTGPISAWLKRDLRLVMADFVGGNDMATEWFWILLVVNTLDYDPQRQILYPNDNSILLLCRADSVCNDG